MMKFKEVPVYYMSMCDDIIDMTLISSVVL